MKEKTALARRSRADHSPGDNSLAERPAGNILLFPAPDADNASAQWLQRFQQQGPGAAVALLLETRKSADTRRQYERCLCNFFREKPPRPETVQHFLQQPVSRISLDLAQFQLELKARGLGSSSINQHMAAIKSLLKIAHRFEWCLTDGSKLIEGEKARAYKDTRGYSMATVDLMVQAPNRRTAKRESKQADVRVLRDSAIMLLLADNLLRCVEVHRLDVDDFELKARRLWIRGKGKEDDPDVIDLSKETTAALLSYLEAAGHADGEGPLFRNLHRDPRINGKRISRRAIFDVVRNAGIAVGQPNARPHGLRHSGITALKRATNGDVFKMKSISRHAKIETLQAYVDNANETQLEMTELLGELRRGKSRG